MTSGHRAQTSPLPALPRQRATQRNSQPHGPGVLAATTAAFTGEVIGTFMLTFSGSATILAVHTLQPHAGTSIIDDIAVSLAFALGIVAAVYTVASISGAHLNPAITLGLACVRRFPWRQVPVYLGAQLAGGLLAGLVNWLLFPALRELLALGTTKPGPGVAWWPALIAEVIITAVLMIVVMATAVFEKSPGGAAQSGLAIGLWIGAAIFLATPISGGSMNPARTLGPDIVAASFPSWWVYLVGPIVGAILGALLWEHLLSKGDKQTVETTGH